MTTKQIIIDCTTRIEAIVDAPDYPIEPPPPKPVDILEQLLIKKGIITAAELEAEK